VNAGEKSWCDLKLFTVRVGQTRWKMVDERSLIVEELWKVEVVGWEVNGGV